MKLIYFIALWLSLGETARVKIDADNSWGLILLYLFAPLIHLTVFLTHGTAGYLNKSWTTY